MPALDAGFSDFIILNPEACAAFFDEIKDEEIHDTKRISYLEENIKQTLLAKEEGVNVSGYFVWTLMDNFEWHEGYKPRFGLVYVDFSTNKRIIKASGFWYQKFLAASSKQSSVQKQSAEPSFNFADQ